MTTRILVGNCLAVLAAMPAESVSCVVTSPPYWGLRSYGVEPTIWGGRADCAHGIWRALAVRGGGAGEQGRTGQRASRSSVSAAKRQRGTGEYCEFCGAWRGDLGLEPTPELYVGHIVQVFAAVRRVLRPDGTAWVNMGDCYANDGKWGGKTGGKNAYIDDASLIRVGREHRHTGLKPKDMVGMPWRVAFALQADGWWLRQEIIWHKPNPMPESIGDRFTKAHEQIFLLAKSGSPLLYRARDTREWASSPNLSERIPNKAGTGTVRRWRGFDYYFDQDATLEPASANTHLRVTQDVASQRGSGRAHAEGKLNGAMKAVVRMGGGNRSHKGKTAYDEGAGEHRTKQGLVGYSERMRKLGEGDSDGVKNNARFNDAMVDVVLERNKRSVWTVGTRAFKGAHFATFPPDLVEPCIKAGCPAGGVVLDPFGGAGTVGLVADRLGRDSVLIELNPAYADMAAARIRADASLTSEVVVVYSSDSNTRGGGLVRLARPSAPNGDVVPAHKPEPVVGTKSAPPHTPASATGPT